MNWHLSQRNQKWENDLINLCWLFGWVHTLMTQFIDDYSAHSYHMTGMKRIRAALEIVSLPCKSMAVGRRAARETNAGAWKRHWISKREAEGYITSKSRLSENFGFNISQRVLMLQEINSRILFQFIKVLLILRYAFLFWRDKLFDNLSFSWSLA